MRTRLLKPGFFRNETLAQLDDFTRLLFMGLWCLADREGRLVNNPRALAAQLFPHDNIRHSRVFHSLGQLFDNSFIQLYSAKVDGRDVDLISIPTFVRHQHPHHREPPSHLPAPPVGNLAKLRPPEKPRAQPRAQPGLSPGPSLGHSLGLSPSDTNTYTDLASQDPKYTAADAADVPTAVTHDAAAREPGQAENHFVIVKVCHEVMDLLGVTSVDVADTVKGLCAHRKIAYNSEAVGKAIDAAIVQRNKAKAGIA